MRSIRQLVRRHVGTPLFLVVLLAAGACSRESVLLLVLSDDEEEYRTRYYLGTLERAAKELHRDALRAAGAAAPEDVAEAYGRVAAQRLVTWAALVRDAEVYSAPPLYRQFHERLVERYENLEIAVERDAAAFLAFGQQLDARLRVGMSENEFDRVVADVTAAFERDYMTALELAEAIDATSRSSLVAEDRNIRDEIRRRASKWPSYALGRGRAVEIAFELQWAPYIVPVRVSVNTQGEIELSGSGSIPTPIGVFTIGATIRSSESRTLRIHHGGRVHVYSLNSDQFAFDLSHYAGPVSIRYDGDGNVDIILG